MAEAFAAWRRGADVLREFSPVDPVVLVRIHVGVDAAFAITFGAFSLLLLRRIKLSRWLSPVAVLATTSHLLIGLLELAIAFGPHDDRYAGAFATLGAIRAAAWTVVVVVVAALRRSALGDVVSELRSAPATARIVLVAASGFAILLHLGDIGAQMEDLLRRELRVWQGWGPLRILAALLLYLSVIWVIRRLVLQPGDPPSGVKLMVSGVAAVGLGTLVIVLGRGSGLVVLGAMVFVVGGLSHLAGDSSPSAPEGSGRWLYVLAAVLPPISLAVLTGRLLAAEAATHGPWLRLSIGASVLLLVAVAAGWRFQRSDPPLGGPTAYVPLFLIAAAPLGVAVFELGSTGASAFLAKHLGVLGGGLVALAGFAALGGAVRRILGANDRPSVVAWVHMQRTPVVTFLVAWFLLTNLVGVRLERDSASPHVVRALPSDPGSGLCTSEVVRAALGPLAPNEEAIGEALCGWIQHNARVDRRTGGPDHRVPLVLVTASGGGVRAAAWTARVLDCLLLAPDLAPGTARDPCGSGRVAAGGLGPAWPLLFGAGGASGGSVGIVSTAAQRVAPVPLRREPEGGRNAVDWIHEVAEVDHVGPLAARMMFGELPLAPLGVFPGHDRAEVLIENWAGTFGTVGRRCERLEGRSLSGLGFLELRRHCPHEVPQLLLNGTVVRTGDRLNISPLDGAVATHGERSSSWASGVDLLDVLCPGDDVRLFDAAFLSARFPLVTPSGRILPDEDCGRDQASGVDGVDGGYRENSGTAQIGELWKVLGPMLERYEEHPHPGYRPLQPVLVRIENGEVDEPDPVATAVRVVVGAPVAATDQGDTLQSDVGEPLRPAEALYHARSGGREETRSAERGLLSALAEDQVPVLHFALHRHPGRRLPLGWTLTEDILDDIDRVLSLCPNLEEVARFRSLIDGRPLEPVRGCPGRGGNGARVR